MRLERFKTIVLPALLLLLSVSFLLNALLYSQLRKYYTMLYAIELDPLDLTYFPDEMGPPDESEQTVVFFGDSRAAQWPAPAVEGFWFTNRGIGNQTSAQVASRFDDHIRPLHPDIVVLQLCINDLKTIPLFPDRRREIVLNCETNIQKIVKDSRDLDSTVVITTIFPSGQIPLARRLVWSDDIERSIREVNMFLLSFPDDGVIVFDAAKLLSDEDGKIKTEYSFDELHLTEAGYQALNVEFVKMLESLRPESP
jgi:lysophospholipase L1-like esterase